MRDEFFATALQSAAVKGKPLQRTELDASLADFLVQRYAWVSVIWPKPDGTFGAVEILNNVSGDVDGFVRGNSLLCADEATALELQRLVRCAAKPVHPQFVAFSKR